MTKSEAIFALIRRRDWLAQRTKGRKFKDGDFDRAELQALNLAVGALNLQIELETIRRTGEHRQDVQPCA